MSTQPVARHKTAMTRAALSRPLATAVLDGLLEPPSSVFDYGCGRGDDLRHLKTLGFDADGWDPSHRPAAELHPADVVNLGYVINVIEQPAERATALRGAWALTKRLLVVSARMAWDARDLAGQPMGDGLVTRTGTFQKFFDQKELSDWIQRVLGVQPHAAAPGIFYIFRDPRVGQRFVASRVYTYRPRVRIEPQTLYDHNESTLAPLLAFMSDHARVPKRAELPAEAAVRIEDSLGSISRAQRLIKAVTDDSYWHQVTIHRRAELLIYVALSRFGRRPRYSELDGTLARDVLALFGTYRQACLEGDRLLLACGDQAIIYVNARSSKVGKQTPSALYVHRSAIAETPPVLQVYEGCARVLAGTVEGANLVKMSVLEPKVSYLRYPDFDRDPHPILASAVTVNLGTLTVARRDYQRSQNPPILHRKEEFLGAADARRERYERLTRSEVRAGLYSSPEQIGTLAGWEEALRTSGYRLRGHQLVRGTSTPRGDSEDT